MKCILYHAYVIVFHTFLWHRLDYWCTESKYECPTHHYPSSGLARIGQGSKLEKLASTGRFGLGFSSTYHLTDTPSFVSGDYLVVFDPHCSFAPGGNILQPGVRIKFKGEEGEDSLHWCTVLHCTSLHVTSHYFTSHHINSCHRMSCHIASCNVTSCHFTSHLIGFFMTLVWSPTLDNASLLFLSTLSFLLFPLISSLSYLSFSFL